VDKFGQHLANLGEVWTKVIKNWANLIRFGKNQNLALLKLYMSYTLMLGGANSFFEH